MTLRPSGWLLPCCFLLTLSGCDEAGESGGDGAAGGGGGGSEDSSGGAAPIAGTTGGGGSNSDAGSSGSGGASAGAGGQVSAGGGGPTGGPGMGGTGAAPASGGSSPMGGAASGGSGGESGVGGTSSDGGAAAAGGASSDGLGGETTAGGSSMGGGGTSSVGGTPEICSFEINGSLSPEISTVGVVDWSTDLAGLTEARIEFSLNEPGEGELNLGGGGPIAVAESRALLLGLKPARSYTYRIVASAGDTVCVSPDQSLTTEVDPNARTMTRVAGATASTRANGFIVACSYNYDTAFIVDTDGDVVWSSDAPAQCSRAHMDWSGEYLWTLKANPTFDNRGEVSRVRMDGTGAEQVLGLEGSHHDFAALPDGAMAFLIWADDTDLSSDLVERAADGTLSALARLDDVTYESSARDWHANALRYYANDDSYTVSDLLLPGVTKFDRQGQLQLQHGGTWMLGVHGHQLLENGNLLFFSATNGTARPVGAPSPVYEYSFSGSEQVLEWSYESEISSMIMGDVQRLPNGNTLVTYSAASINSVIQEISPAGDVVYSLGGGLTLGYVGFRETLYGPPQ